MDKQTEPLSLRIFAAALSVVVLAWVAYYLVFQRSQPGVQRTAYEGLPVIGSVADFSLTNQAGQAASLADLRGRVWLADIIFTRCAGPCIRMTRQMKSLQDALTAGDDVKLVSLTTNPEYDAPEILKKYADDGADATRWTFLTGTKKEIGALAVNSLKLTAVPVKPEDQSGPDDFFVHSTIFVLVDKQARLRGVFETGGEGVDWTNVQPAIIANIQKLESEP